MNEEQPRSQAADTPEATQQTPPVQSAGIAQPVVSSSKGPNKRLIGLIAGIALVLLGAGAVWFFVMRDQDAATQGDQQDNQANQQQNTETQLLTLPDVVAYAHRDNDASPFKIFTRPATGGDRTEVMTLAANEYITHHTVHGRQVAFGVTNNEQEVVYYSDNSGASYVKIFVGEPSAGEGTLPQQITSMKFSTDGQALVLGLLSSDSKNHVTEVSLNAPYETTELFTSDSAGVFTVGYDHAKQSIIYFTGCYNCDGNGYGKLFARSLADDTEKTLHQADVAIYAAVNQSFEAVLIATGVLDPSADGIGDTSTAPYTISTVGIENGAKTNLSTFHEGRIQGVGYTPTGKAYVFTSNKVIIVGEANSAIYETTGSINWKGDAFVGEDRVVVATGSQDSADFNLHYFKLGDTEPANILKGDGNTVVFGVALKAE